ncbi:MAG: peptidase M48 [Rhodobacteraceae bacterium]|nr:MAG: peptidase M48 [Paracoccaceae bacterium]
MLKLTPILLAIVYALIMYRFSVWRTKSELREKSTPLTDPRMMPALRQMADALDLEQIKVLVYEIEPVNGLAAPDGRIYLTRGFMNKFNHGDVSVDELASVVAHELGHVALGHSRRRMIDFSGQNALRVALAMILGRFLPGIGVYLANFLTTMLAARLSRTDEFEADAYAAALLTKSGIGTAGQKRLLEKLEQMSGSAKRPMAWLMSHPKTAQRVAAIEKLEKTWSVSN